MDWFRMYADVVNHEKLMLLSAEAFRFWVMTLCVAARSEPRGTLPNITAIAFRTRSEQRSAQVLIEELIAAHLVDRSEDGSLSVHDWDQHQRKSDDAAGRMRDIRGKNQGNPSSGKGKKKGGLMPVQNTFGTSSEHVRARAEQSRADTEQSRADRATDAAIVLPATPDGPIDPAMCPPFPNGDTSLIDVKSGSHSLTDADAREIFGKVWTLTGTMKACHEFYEDQNRHTAKTWREAITEAAKRGVQVRSVGYLHTIAGDIETGKLKAKSSSKPRPVLECERMYVNPDKRKSP